jgi:hypothetical protein
MSLRWLIICLAGLLTIPAQAVGPVLKSPQKSISTTGQFVIYCDDLAMRLEVTSYAENLKRHVLAVLGLKDEWQVPCVITIVPERAAYPDRPPSEVRLLESEGGFSEELNVTITDHPADAHFQQQLIRAILLEIAYRGTGLIKDGKPFNEPPGWLIEGLAWYLQTRETGTDADIFKTIINVNKLPSLQSFLAENPAGYDSVSLAVYRAYSMSLLEVLMDMPGGRPALGRFVQAIPRSKGDPAADLRQAFPALETTAQSMEKWWTLSIARLSASDRYRGLSLEETEKRLQPLLQVEIPMGKETKTFALTDFRSFLKLKTSRPVLAQQSAALLELEVLANPLLKPAVAEYELAASELARGRTKHVEDLLKDAGQYRDLVLKRLDAVADYLNWFEATQIKVQSHDFDNYLRDAKALNDAPPPHRDDPISRYMDVMEQQLK